MKILIIFLNLFFISQTFGAGDDGGIVSSGGQLFKDANHPWFLMDVKEVTYCIQLDSPSFSRTHQEVAQMVEEVIEYWKKQFQRSNPFSRQEDYSLGQQTFRETACGPTTQLRLVMGQGALEKDDLDFLKDPKRYIGVTVRKSYKKIQGSGFIYITSDKGPNAYPPENRIPLAWQYDKLLKYALIHEFGHVFGISHMGTGIMSESFLDQMLTKDFAQVLLKNPLENFIAPSDVLVQCGLEEQTKEWFAIPQNANCLHLARSGRLGEWSVYYKSALDAEVKTQIGIIKGFVINIKDYESRPISFMHLPLPADQETFSAEKLKGKALLVGPSFLQMGGEAVYSPINDVSKAIYLKMNPTGLTILGVLRDKPLPVFIYTSPLDILIKLK